MHSFDQRDTCADDLSSELMKIVYGCTIKVRYFTQLNSTIKILQLQHQASGKYLSVKQVKDENTNLIKVNNNLLKIYT